jgi:hypothetical protein
MVSTLASHAGNAGSNPAGGTIFLCEIELARQPLAKIEEDKMDYQPDLPGIDWNQVCNPDQPEFDFTFDSNDDDDKDE